MKRPEKSSLFKKKLAHAIALGAMQGERITYLHNKPCEQAMH